MRGITLRRLKRRTSVRGLVMFVLAGCVGVLVVAALRYQPAPPTYTEPAPGQTAPAATSAMPVGPLTTHPPGAAASPVSTPSRP
ncbi:hypothetical protein B1R94_10895 [Mycolicibacterium litorale]|nr:hypothetical protein B1R94_10895 [Mycolicibacterium litorale]